MRQLRDLRVDREHRTRAIGDRQRHQAEQLAPVAPGMQARVLVLAENEDTLVVGVRLGQLAHRVERVADAAPAQFAALEHEARLAGDRQAHHRFAVGRTGKAARLLPRLADRDPAQLVETQLLERRLRQGDVGVVHRVETASEQADAHHPGRHSAHSRGRRKSL